MYDQDDISHNPRLGHAESLGGIIARRLNRRAVLRGAASAAALAATVSPMALLSGCGDGRDAPAESAGGEAAPFPGFTEITRGVDSTHHVPEGYAAEILIRWGDPVLSGAPTFTPAAQTPAAQGLQFGYNNDFIGYMPLPRGSDTSDHGLLCVNHEYTSEEVMFPTLYTITDAGERIPTPLAKSMTPEERAALERQRAEIEMAAHGGTVIEIARENGAWKALPGTTHARRITAATPMRISGPAAGHDWMKTQDDPTGTRVHGTINNCAGGVTPWGTWLMAEENFYKYFSGPLPEGDGRIKNYFRYSLPNGGHWALADPRFNMTEHPNEPNRFGWIVEVDPFDPASTPVKRTALGRFFHEGAETLVNPDSRVVVYSSDDSRFEYLYKFVTAGTFNPDDPAANADLLDEGTLFVARFGEDGTVTWLPLTFGRNGLDETNGFDSQGQVLIESRRAADVLGATPMDRPEDVQPNPVNGKVYVMLTNNSLRGNPAYPSAGPGNPRNENYAGHIIELTPRGGDHAATTCQWEVLVRCGDPTRKGIDAAWNPATSENGWFTSPDNAAVDADGNLWVVTDQGGGFAFNSNTPDPALPPEEEARNISADGMWLLGTEGERRGTGRMFFRAPVGAEVCGPRFTPDGRTVFLAIQHPGDGGAGKWQEHLRPSTFEDPATRWPDFNEAMPPRPSVVVITRNDGGKIGS